jgi:hypothetical protein
MKRDSEALKLRTKDFALRVLLIRLFNKTLSLPSANSRSANPGYPASSLQHIDRCKLPSGVPRKVSG